MNSKTKKILEDVFGIYNIDLATQSYNHHDYKSIMIGDYVDMPPMVTKRHMYNANIEPSLLDELVKAIEYDTGNNNNFVISNGMPIDILYDYLKNMYERDAREKQLQNKYPELAEIAKEYEIMKALILKK